LTVQLAELDATGYKKRK